MSWGVLFLRGLRCWFRDRGSILHMILCSFMILIFLYIFKRLYYQWIMNLQNMIFCFKTWSVSAPRSDTVLIEIQQASFTRKRNHVVVSHRWSQHSLLHSRYGGFFRGLCCARLIAGKCLPLFCWRTISRRHSRNATKRRRGVRSSECGACFIASTLRVLLREPSRYCVWQILQHLFLYTVVNSQYCVSGVWQILLGNLMRFLNWHFASSIIISQVAYCHFGS